MTRTPACDAESESRAECRFCLDDVSDDLFEARLVGHREDGKQDALASLGHGLL